MADRSAPLPAPAARSSLKGGRAISTASLTWGTTGAGYNQDNCRDRRGPAVLLVSFYLSSDPAITTADIKLGDKNIGNLAPGASQTVTTSVTIPSAIPPGTHYLGAIADRNGNITETNEANIGLTAATIIVN